MNGWKKLSFNFFPLPRVHIVSKGPHFGQEPKFPNFHIFLPIWVWRAKKFFAKPRNSFPKKVRLVAFYRNKSNNEIGTLCQLGLSLLSLGSSRKTTQHGLFSMLRICPGQIRYLSGKWRLITVCIDSYVSTSATARRGGQLSAGTKWSLSHILYTCYN